MCFISVSKKRSTLGAEFSELVKQIRSSGLRRPDEAIAFILTRANAQSVSIRRLRFISSDWCLLSWKNLTVFSFPVSCNLF